MQNTNKYYQLEEITAQDSAFVLDCGAFNRLRGEKSLLTRLERIVEWKMSGEKTEVPKTEDIVEDLKKEAVYLLGLTKNLRDLPNFFMTRSVVEELRGYHKRIDRTINQLRELGINAAPASVYLGGVSSVVNASKNHCLPRSRKVIQRNEDRLRDYAQWMQSLPLMNVGVRDYESRRSFTDETLMAFTLCLAWEQPAILLTGDANHVGRGLKDFYSPSTFKFYKAPKINPPHRVKAYVGFNEGWRLWVDSSNPPA